MIGFVRLSVYIHIIRYHARFEILMIPNMEHICPDSPVCPITDSCNVNGQVYLNVMYW